MLRMVILVRNSWRNTHKHSRPAFYKNSSAFKIIFNPRKKHGAGSPDLSDFHKFVFTCRDVDISRLVCILRRHLWRLYVEGAPA